MWITITIAVLAVVVSLVMFVGHFRATPSSSASSNSVLDDSKVEKSSVSMHVRKHVPIDSEDAAAAKTVTKEDVADNSEHIVPTSVNYHFTRVCNYSCGFCFHTAKTSHVETLDNAKKGIKLLHDAGMLKINFAGGEPFLEPKKLGEMVRYCKEIATAERPLAVSIVSNGSKITKTWIEEYGQFVDILAVSCDSFDEVINKDIGRTAGGANHVKKLWQVRDWCQEHGIKFKINTVVNSMNWEEDMNEHIASLAPARWKVFQCLLLEGENDGGDAKRDARKFLISKEQFEAFCKRHEEQKSLVPEDNEHMQTSYLILDEYMRFLDCTNKGKAASVSILTHGVQAALRQSGFNPTLFEARGGRYDYSRESTGGCSLPKELEF